MRVPLVVLAAALVAAGFGAVGVFADDGAAPTDQKAALPTAQELEKLSGKDLYRETCRTCHGVKSKAGDYKPLSLIQEQWERFFDEKYLKTHQAVVDSARGVPVTDWITPKMLEKIRGFAIDGAADSEHPMTCG